MTDEEAITAYAALHTQHEVFWQAACQAAIDAGAAKPQGVMERMAAGNMAYQGTGWFEQTEVAQARVLQAAPEQALIGAAAYVRGRAGNAYTRCLRDNYGPYQPGR
jgi:hypothetical protein